MADYSEEIAAVLQSIKDTGELVTWKVFQGATYKNIPALFLPDTRIAYAWMIQKPDQAVPSGMKQCLLPGTIPFIPTVKDIVTRASGQQLKMSSYNELDPNGQVIMYFAQLTR